MKWATVLQTTQQVNWDTAQMRSGQGSHVQAYRKVLRVLSTVAMCRYSRWLPSDSTSDSWPFSSSLLRLERGFFFLRTEPRVRRSRHARIMWARSCWSRWKFSLQETHLNACPVNVSQSPPPGLDVESEM